MAEDPLCTHEPGTLQSAVDRLRAADVGAVEDGLIRVIDKGLSGSHLTPTAVGRLRSGDVVGIEYGQPAAALCLGPPAV